MKMIFRLTLFIMFVALVFILFPGCGGSSDDDSDDDSAEDDSASDDTVQDDDTSEANFLYAASGETVITPSAENHPEQIYLGGVVPSRVCTGVHDDLKATALALKQGGQSVVLVSLDLVGFTSTRIREIQERLDLEGLDSSHILISSTHTHEGPDTIGVYGPNLLTSGVSPEYMQFVQNAVADLIADTWSRIEPVTMKVVKADVNFPDSNEPTLMNDQHRPFVRVPFLAAAQFTGESGEAVATLINWHAHPEVMIESTLVTSDFAGYLRQHVADRGGGQGVYISGAVGGLMSPTGAEVPARDADDNLLLDGEGNQIYLLEASYDKTRSLGFVIADLALDALDAASDAPSPALNVKVQGLPLPVTGILFILGYLTNLLEISSEDVITSDPSFCGPIGCSADRIALVRLGPLTIITSPGETYPETFLGRPESSYDYGSPWGVTDYAAMTGMLDSYGDAVPMLMSLCGNEIAYLVPSSDWHPIGHPDHYAEDLCLGRETEELYRTAAIDLLDESQ